MPTFDQAVASRLAVGEVLGESSEGVAGPVDLSGAFVGSEAVAAGRTITLSVPDAANSPSGLIGLHIDRDAEGNASGISFDTAGSPVWEMGLDYDTTDFVLAYDQSIPGDTIRGRVGSHWDIGRSVGQPGVGYRLQVSSDAGDGVALADIVAINVLTGSPADNFLNCVNDGVSKFSISAGGAVSAQGALTVNAPIQGSTVLGLTGLQVGTGTATGKLDIFGANLVGTAIDLHNAAGLNIRITAGIPNVAESGWCVYDSTNSKHRIVVTGGGSIILANQTALATNATAGHLTVPDMAGTPTGVPDGDAWGTSLVVDTSGSKLWAYIGGAWKSVTLA